MNNFRRQNCSARKLVKSIFFEGISSQYTKGIIFKLIFLRTSCFLLFSVYFNAIYLLYSRNLITTQPSK